MAEASVDAAVRSIAEANVNFAFDLYKTLDQGNFFFSPLSIQVILTLVYFGARNETARQIREALRIFGNDDAIKQGIEAAMRELNACDDILLDVANKIFLKTGYLLEKEFLQAAAKFMAGVEEVNFYVAEAARKTINDWVEMKTHDKIKDLIPAGVLDEDTRLVLVNAVYFKAEWQKQFDKNKTTPMPFHMGGFSMKTVDMMHTKSKFKYALRHDLSAQVLALPYKGGKLSMLIFLPLQVDGLSNLESKLGGLNLRDVMSNMYRNDVIVYLPKFRMEYGKQLNGILARLGMTDMFVKVRADFTGITTDERLYVDKVIHKAFVEVSEEGTEAAAATAVVVATITSVGSGPPPPIVFKADHPFMFLIVEEKTQHVLFVGRYSSPPP